MDDEDKYFEKKIIFMSKNLHSATCWILVDGWQLMTSTWHHGCSYNGVALVVENELLWQNCNWIAMNCTIHTMSCNFVTHATCLLALTMYKYNELQMSYAEIELQC
jgi:hypothetical protein